MHERLSIKRTSSSDQDFNELIIKLDHELWNELKEDQGTYDQYNKVPGLQTVVLVYLDAKPVACGCFKKFDNETVEVKRMFVEKAYRGRGFSRLVLDELETWAVESGFHYSVLETSIHFKVAQNLYHKEGYEVIENYGQYTGLKESICMKKELFHSLQPSEFKNLTGLEYFLFEEDFIERNIRCIPMIVRFKMDKAGIKLKLAEWSRFTVDERITLALKPCRNEHETRHYNIYLSDLVKDHTGKEATVLIIDNHPLWADLNSIPVMLSEKLKKFDCDLSIQQWKNLTDLQRFALLKLCKEGHENKNFPKAIKEFKLTSSH